MRRKKFSFALTLSTTNGSGAKNTVLLSEPLNKNIFLRGFLADLYLRPSCHACPAKKFKSGSDVTIGDFWGAQNVMPEIDDDKGVSVVMVNDLKTDINIKNSKVKKWSTNYNDILLYNPSVEKSVKLIDKRECYFNKTKKTFSEKVNELTKIPILKRIKQKIKYLIFISIVKNN